MSDQVGVERDKTIVNWSRQDLRAIDEFIISGDMLALMLKEAGKIPKIKPEENISLARDIWHGKLAERDLAKGGFDKSKKSSLEKEVKRAQRSKQEMILRNRRLVAFFAYRYTGRGMSYEDMIQEGSIGLMRAVDKFDHKKGYAFSTYAAFWIRALITRGIANQGRSIRLPQYKNDQVAKSFWLEEKLIKKLKRDPEEVELAKELEEKLKVSPAHAEEILKIRLWPESLDAPIDDDENGRALMDVIEDIEADSPDELAEMSLVQDIVEEALEGLSKKKKMVFRLIYDFEKKLVREFAEVGRHVKVDLSRERVRQIHREVLDHISANGFEEKLETIFNSI